MTLCRTGIGAGLVLLLLVAGCRATARENTITLYDLHRDRRLDAAQSLAKLEQAKLILVGEHHTSADHHRAQLAVVAALHQAGRKVAIGLEMFRKQSQAALDQWVNGDMDETAFRNIYLDNWNYDWSLYQPIFQYARSNRIAMVGLNVPRATTSQVAYHGFDSLSDEQKSSLGTITCNVTPEYHDFIRSAYGAHGHGNMRFDRFCEAQLVWDTAMAVNAVGFLENNPDHILVILAGSVHTRKMGIPTQLEKRTDKPVVVILPLTPGYFDRDHTDAGQADYLLTMP